jgi:hypothetical protein
MFHNCTDNSHISTTACSVGHCIYIIAVRVMCFQDLQNFLDEVQEGVIYFTLDTKVLSDRLPEEKRRAFIDAFST